MTTSAMVSMSVNCTSSTEARMVVVRSVRMVDLHRRRQRGLELGQQLLDAIDHLDNVGARLPLHVDNDRRHRVHPGRLLDVLGAVNDVGDVGQPHWRAILVRQ